MRQMKKGESICFLDNRYVLLTDADDRGRESIVVWGACVELCTGENAGSRFFLKYAEANAEKKNQYAVSLLKRENGFRMEHPYIERIIAGGSFTAETGEKLYGRVHNCLIEDWEALKRDPYGASTIIYDVCAVYAGLSVI